MKRPTPMAWVKLWTDNDGDWLAMPLEDRAIFYELLKMGGRAWPRGKVKGQDIAIAALMAVPVKVFSESLERLIKDRSIKRVAGGLSVVNFDKFQAPAMALSHAQRGPSSYRDKTRGEETRGEGPHPLLAGYDLWVASPRDGFRLDNLVKQYPTLSLADELSDFMAYAERRATAGNAYVDYIAAFANHLKSQHEYHKKRGWLPEAKPEDLTPDQIRERLRVVS